MPAIQGHPDPATDSCGNVRVSAAWHPEALQWANSVLDAPGIRALDMVLCALQAASEKPEEVVLFGSHARGEATEHSDLDILAVYDDQSPSGPREILQVPIPLEPRIQMLSDVNAQTGHLVQLIAMGASEWRNRTTPLARNAARDGIRLA